MSELPIDSLETWYDKKTRELYSSFESEVNKRLDRIKGAARDTGLVLNEMTNLKTTEQDEVQKTALEKFVEKISSTIEDITFPNGLTYNVIGDFLSRLKRSVEDIFDAGRRWIPRLRGRQYKSVLLDLDKHFRELTKETQTLDNIYRNYRHLGTVERVREDINELNEMLTRIPETNSEIKEQEKQLESARELVNKNESLLKDYKKRTGAHEKEEIDKELERIRQTLVSQLDLLRKAMLKMRELVETGSLHVKPEHVSTIDLYSRDLDEAINSESDGCPALKSLLSDMEKLIDNLGLEGSRKRRTLKRIDSLLKSDLLTSAQKRVKVLLQRSKEISQVYQPGEEQKISAELDESRKHLRDQETKMHRLEEELEQLNSKLKQKAKEITSEIARLTGQKIRISLKR